MKETKMTALRLVEDLPEHDPDRSTLLVDEATPVLSPTGDGARRFTVDSVSTFTGFSFFLSAIAIITIVLVAFLLPVPPMVCIYALGAVVVADGILVTAEVVGTRARRVC